jgi:threonine synthase
MTHQECINCGAKYGIDEIIYFCRKCGDLLEVKYDFDEIKRKL